MTQPLTHLPSLPPPLVHREKQLLSSIMSGNALEHHLEPSYYAALDQALKNSKQTDTG